MAFLIILFFLLLKLISTLNIARPQQFPWASQSVVEIGTLSETFLWDTLVRGTVCYISEGTCMESFHGQSQYPSQ